ncbi:MAG: glutamate formimidoyltransferase [Prolixibacteraceae bacterium]|jgi:glutamate formiminotransferase/formiminotetrahydrofolate cyclodeaminase|nr:glutamate formimidoyltransferase [Prolixibacteraceae bacterium]
MKQLIECVPNFSEGSNMHIIKQITDEIVSVKNVRLLNVDSGKAANRTVVTFVGTPAAVCEAAFRAVKMASQLIDMRKHKGEHPRFGATDVLPLIPVSGIAIDELVEYAHRLGERIGAELNIPVYCYEFAASNQKRQNLANCRSGECEGLPRKMTDPEWKPDFGPVDYHESVAKTGAIALGVRNFLIAYNVNLNTTSAKLAGFIASEIREKGRVKRVGNTSSGEIITDKYGKPVYEPGMLKTVKGIGWYIEEYGIAQLSFNLTNIGIASMHHVYEATCRRAEANGVRVTGSELVGMVPLKAILDAGKYYLEKQHLPTDISEDEIVNAAIKFLGLDQLAPFDPKKKIIEYRMVE